MAKVKSPPQKSEKDNFPAFPRVADVHVQIPDKLSKETKHKLVAVKEKAPKALVQGASLVGMYIVEFTRGEDGKLVPWRNRKFVKPEQAEINVGDFAVVYGRGIFEGINFYKDGILFFKEHIDRFYAGMEIARLEMPMSREEFEKLMFEAIERSGLKQGYIRPILTAGRGKDGTLGINVGCEDPCVFVYVCPPLALYTEETYKKGIRLVESPYRKQPKSVMGLNNLKWTCYFTNLLVKAEAKERGYDDGVMLLKDPKGNKYVSEVSAANLFFMKNNVLYTPSLESNCLEGITRNAFIKLAREKGIEVVEKQCTLAEFMEADEAFATGTAAGLIAVSEITGRRIGTGAEGETTGMLRKAYYEEVVPNSLTPFAGTIRKFEELEAGKDYFDLGEMEEKPGLPPRLE